MLVLSRYVEERIFIGEGDGRITVTVVEIGRDRVRLGIDAHDDVQVDREEVAIRVQREGRRR